MLHRLVYLLHAEWQDGDACGTRHFVAYKVLEGACSHPLRTCMKSVTLDRNETDTLARDHLRHRFAGLRGVTIRFVLAIHASSSETRCGCNQFARRFSRCSSFPEEAISGAVCARNERPQTLD